MTAMASLERVGWPYGASIVAGGVTVASLLLDDQNEGVAAVVEIEEDATITHVGIRCAAKTGTPADDSYTVSIQGLTTGGLADNTPVGGTALATFPNATYPVAGFGTGTYHWIALGASVAIQGGTPFAIVVQRTAATDASNCLTITRGSNMLNQPSFPYPLTANSAGTWAKDTANFPHYWGVKSASRTYLWPGTTFQTGLVAGTTTEVGFTFKIPAAYGSNTKGLRGVRFAGAATGGPVAAGTVCVTLYSGPLSASPTTLQQILTRDSDFFNTTVSRIPELLFSDDTLQQLASNTVYGLAIAHSAVSGWSMQYATLADAGDATAYPYGGFKRMTRTLTDYPPSGNDTNAFTETDTGIITAELIFADIVPPAGGSGGGLRLAGHGGLAA